VRMFFAALLAAFALLPTGSALATTYYVTPSGADTNAGTSLGTAFRTIGKLASIVNAGDVVNVKEATSGTSYNYGESVTFNRGGTSGNPVTWHFETHGLNADPLFVSSSTGDYHLTHLCGGGSSPAIDAGDGSDRSSDTVDIYGESQGDLPDIGAIEMPPLPC
jgi:hypothetical protein